jgi:PHS family inorganic phosphate transporter-like MFS transporter
LPAVIYPYEVRSTFHGLSAGCGKLGAVVGTFIYQPISDKFGIAAVLWVQVAFSVLGALTTIIFIQEPVKQVKVGARAALINSGT